MLDNPYKHRFLIDCDRKVEESIDHRKEMIALIQKDCDHPYIAEEAAGMRFSTWRNKQRICLECGLEEIEKFSSFEVLTGEFIKPVDNVYDYRFPC